MMTKIKYESDGISAKLHINDVEIPLVSEVSITHKAGEMPKLTIKVLHSGDSSNVHDED